MGSSIVKNAPPQWKKLIGETVGLEEGVYVSPLIFLFHFSVNLICFKKHRNMYTIKGETDHQPRLDAWDKRSDLVLWEDLEGAGGEGGGRGDRDGEDM